MDWWNVLIFGAIPVLTVAILFFVKRKLLWTAPLISAALAFATYMIALDIIVNPSYFVKFFSYSEYRGFFILAMLMHLGVVILLTVIAYLAAYILKRKQKNR